MCGRATLTEPDLDAVAEALDAVPTGEARAAYRPRWNAAPGERLCVLLLRSRRVLEPMTWGLPGRGGQPLVNLRGEKAGARPVGQRCVLPVDGFYEWSGPPGDRRPHWFHPAAGGLLRLAAIWGETPAGPSFAVLTAPAAGPVAPIHDRMPAILAPDRIDAWLAGAPLAGLLAPAEGLLEREVSPRVNSAGADDPSCLDPPPPGRPQQLGLFGGAGGGRHPA